MGCQQSKLAAVEGPETLRIEAQPTATKYGIECSTTAADGEPVIEPEETPQEIRNIREELFPKSAGSILTTASSSAETSSTTGYSRSFGSGYSAPSHDDDSTVRQIGYTNTGCRFMDYSRNEDNDDDDDDDESQLQPSYSQRKGRSGGRRASFESGNRYHYPASLYEDMRRQKHFVPPITTGNNATTSSINLRQQPRTSLPSIRSGITSMSGRRSEDEDEGTSSFASSPGGLSSFGGDVSVDDSQVEMFQQFDALVDTMALSLEPEQKEKLEKLTKQSVLSLGALVDKLTEMDDGLAVEDACDEEESGILMAAVEEESGDDDKSEGSSSRSPTVAPSSNSRVRAPTAATSKDRRYAAPAPMLEQSDSSELLANMKTLALMTDVQETLARPNEAEDGDDNDTHVSYCSGNSKTLKFHRSSSVAPSSSVSVCSELRWM